MDNEQEHRPQVDIHHNKFGDVLIELGPVINGWGLGTLFLAAIFIGVYWMTHPSGFVALVFTSVNTVAGIVNILMWVGVAAIGGFVFNRFLLPGIRGCIELFRPAPRVHVHNDNFALYSGRGVQVHDHNQDKSVYNYKITEGQAQNVLQLPAPAESRIPTFTELLDQGIIQQSLQQGKMLIGFVFDAGSNTWVPRFGSWLDLYSCAIAGVIGSGKTTTALFLLLQALLAGAKMVLIDPHLHDSEESLAFRLSMFRESMVFAPCDDTPSDILERTRWLFNEYKRRKALGIKGPALIVVYEEFNACMRNPEVAKEIADLLTIIEQEARKFGIFAILIGQYWSAQGIGNAVIRQCLASALVHRMGDVEQAKKLLGLPQHAKTSLQLKQGHHVFKDTQGGYAETVTPHIVESDLLDVARLLPQNAFASSSQPVRNQFTEPLEDLQPNPTRSKLEANPENQFETALVARARDIIKLQAQNYQKPDVMRMLWGIAPSRSDAYKKAESEYMEAMKIVQSMIAESEA